MGIKPGGIKAAWAALPLELVVGTIMFAHGLPKLNDPAGFASAALGGIPIFLAFMVIAAELAGGLLLLAGLLVRFGAFSHICVMAVAVAHVHWETGLTGRGGFEFPLSLLAASLALLIIGPDPLSIDYNLRVSIFGTRDPVYRRESSYAVNPAAKVAGVILLLAGIALLLAATGGLFLSLWVDPPSIVTGLASMYAGLGLPAGTNAAIITIFAGIASIVSGAALVAGKMWAYTPGFIMARLYLAASTLLLFWVKYSVRGLIAIIISLAMLAALHGARRDQ